jgi:dihydrofolate reductase
MSFSYKTSWAAISDAFAGDDRRRRQNKGEIEMARVVLQVYVTLDGMVHGEGRASLMAWNPPHYTEQLSELVRDIVRPAEAMLLGRNVFEGFNSSWPAREPTAPADQWTVDDDIAAKFNALPKHVASRTLSGALDWNGTVLVGEVPDAVGALKARPGGDIIVYGGGELVQTLMRHNLIDEYHVIVFPVAVGIGEHLFPDDADLQLTSVGSKTLDSGVIDLRYQPIST